MKELKVSPSKYGFHTHFGAAHTRARERSEWRGVLTGRRMHLVWPQQQRFCCDHHAFVGLITWDTGHGQREGVTPRAHSTYLLGNYLQRFNVHELLCSCSDMWRAKVNVSLNSVVPSAWLPKYKVPCLRGQKHARWQNHYLLYFMLNHIRGDDVHGWKNNRYWRNICSF